MTNYKFSAPMYPSYAGMVAADGSFFVPPQSCKDWVHDSITHLFYPEYAKLYSVANFGGKNGPNLERPEFVVSSTGTPKKVVENFSCVVNDLESIMGLDARTEALSLGGGNRTFWLIARTHPFWIKSPVSVSFMLSIMRLACSMEDNMPFWAWMDAIVKKQVTGKEAGYIRVAHAFGNIKGFVEKSLKCLNREGYSDYLLSSHSRGIAWYDAEKDVAPMTEAELLDIRVNRKTYAGAWGASRAPQLREAAYDDVDYLPQNIRNRLAVAAG